MHSSDFSNYLAPNSETSDNNRDREAEDPNWAAGIMSYAINRASLYT